MNHSDLKALKVNRPALFIATAIALTYVVNLKTPWVQMELSNKSTKHPMTCTVKWHHRFQTTHTVSRTSTPDHRRVLLTNRPKTWRRRFVLDATMQCQSGDRTAKYTWPLDRLAHSSDYVFVGRCDDKKCSVDLVWKDFSETTWLMQSVLSIFYSGVRSS